MQASLTVAGMEDLTHRVLGRDGGNLPFKTWEDTARAALALVSQAKRSMLLLSHDLDPPVYDNEAISEAIKGLCLRSRRADARIVVRDSSYAVKHGHRVVELARRLTTCIEIRRPLPDARESEGVFLVVDGAGIMLRQSPGSPEGTVDFRAPAQARRLTDLFSEIWEHSLPDPELRTLHI
jgi:hypothetical protein